ncbi:hypothetical protein ES703_90608 [subsurface metagenome]
MAIAKGSIGNSFLRLPGGGPLAVLDVILTAIVPPAQAIPDDVDIILGVYGYRGVILLDGHIGKSFLCLPGNGSPLAVLDVFDGGVRSPAFGIPDDMDITLGVYGYRRTTLAKSHVGNPFLRLPGSGPLAVLEVILISIDPPARAFPDDVDIILRVYGYRGGALEPARVGNCFLRLPGNGRPLAVLDITAIGMCFPTQALPGEMDIIFRVYGY